MRLVARAICVISVFIVCSGTAGQKHSCTLKFNDVEQVFLYSLIASGTSQELQGCTFSSLNKRIKCGRFKGATLLSWAARQGKFLVVQYLIQAGANANITDVASSGFEGASPLMHACRGGFFEIARYLVEYDANIALKDSEKWTALHYAVLADNVDIVDLLIKKNACVDVKNEGGETPIFLAYSAGRKKVIDYFEEHYGTVIRGVKGPFTMTPVHIACCINNVKVLKLLMRKRLPVDARMEAGHTALHIASWIRSSSCARYLLEGGANIDAPDDKGWSPLFYACSSAEIPFSLLYLRFLIARGACLTTKDRYKKDPLYYLHNNLGRKFFLKIKALESAPTTQELVQKLLSYRFCKSAAKDKKLSHLGSSVILTFLERMSWCMPERYRRLCCCCTRNIHELKDFLVKFCPKKVVVVKPSSSTDPKRLLWRSDVVFITKA